MMAGVPNMQEQFSADTRPGAIKAAAV